MANKRKEPPEVHLFQSLGHENTKRLSFGQGSSEKYHQHALSLARNGKYEEAIEVLKEALLQKDAVKANYVKILDSRSAIYCKMGQYKEAISDAKCIIAAEKQNEKGYLRAGKALLLEGRPEDALKVYKYALKALSKSHPHRESVSKIHDKLVEKMSSCLRDPIQHLNHDCLLEIFKYLSFRQIVAMTRISKAWRAYIKGQPSLWYDISFKGSRPLASPKNMKACILNSQKGVKRLQLHDVKDPHDALLQASMCPRLQHLDLDIKVNQDYISQSSCLKLSLKTLIISNKIQVDRCLLNKMLMLPNLERLEVRQYAYYPIPKPPVVKHLPNLKALVMDIKCNDVPCYFKHAWDPEDVPRVPAIEDLPTRKTYFERTPKLEELRLTVLDVDAGPFKDMMVYLDDICHPHLRILELCDLDLHGTWAFPETIENLRIISCNRFIPIFHCDCDLMPALPNLKALTLALSHWVDLELVLKILKSNDGALESLQLESCDGIRATDLPFLASHTKAFKNLKLLHLHGMGLYSLGDEMLLSLIRNMPQLQELHVPDTAVTGSLIRRIVLSADGHDEGFPRIKLLNLKGCENVSSEAIEWGRAKGLKIITK